MRSLVPCSWLLVLVIISTGGAHGATKTPDKAVFCIGVPDTSPMEFGLTDQRWPAYQKRYPNPIVFTVGKDAATAWPYIHPSTDDSWAGAKAHTFTIRFRLDAAPAKPLYLILGLADAHTPSQLVVTVNELEVARRRTPRGSGSAGGDPARANQPHALVFPIAKEAFRTGDNTIGLTLSDGSWILYDYVCLSRDKQALPFVQDSDEWVADALAGPMSRVPEIVFATRTFMQEHWYANFGYFSPDENRKAYGTGGRLCKLNLKTGKVTLLLDDAEGAVRDPCVHYDGRRIVFAYRKGGTETYHLYEINTDGTGLKQLTDGIYDDFEPCYVPDGGIVFVSARSKRWVNCWLTQVANIYRCDDDGGNVRQLSANLEHDNTPWVLPDGRVLYMRWEYVDRSQVHYHHLWTMNPDGSGQTVFFGNLHPGDVYIDAKPIPGTDRVVLIRSPGHGQPEHAGYLATLDVKRGPDDLPSLRTLTRSRDFRDPWAVADGLYLAAKGNALVLVNEHGNAHTLYTLPKEYAPAALHEPRPVLPRARERTVASQLNLARATGRYFLNNIYAGRNMSGVAPGEIKKLLVLESLPKPVNFTGGMDPLSYVGTFTLERVLGTVPVEADGSAHFEVPAMRSLLFVALDADDLAVKRMQSFTTVGPGEVQGCVGCHEQRVMTPTARSAAPPLAARRPASRIEPIAGSPDVPDFPRDVQPVLDRHCVKCHNPDQPDGGVILCADRGPMFSHGYYSLVVWRQVVDGRNYAQSNYPARALGSGGSPLMQKLDPAHHDVRVSGLERQAVRLWLDAGAPYPGTYAALGTGMIGGYEQNRSVLENDAEWPTTKAAQPVFERRCAACHTADSRPIPRTLSDEIGLSFWAPKMDDPRLKHSRHIVFNLTRPEKSLLLLAPLAKSAGGHGACRAADAPAGSGKLFADTSDPDYRLLLALCEGGRQRLDAIKRFDMPGFLPRPEYVREMKRYGVLPADFELGKTPLDVYAVDRRYWEQFVWKPERQ